MRAWISVLDVCFLLFFVSVEDLFLPVSVAFTEVGRDEERKEELLPRPREKEGSKDSELHLAFRACLSPST